MMVIRVYATIEIQHVDRQCQARRAGSESLEAACLLSHQLFARQLFAGTEGDVLDPIDWRIASRLRARRNRYLASHRR
jgi:hypothetical protein